MLWQDSFTKNSACNIPIVNLTIEKPLANYSENVLRAQGIFNFFNKLYSRVCLHKRATVDKSSDNRVYKLGTILRGKNVIYNVCSSKVAIWNLLVRATLTSELKSEPLNRRDKPMRDTVTINHQRNYQFLLRDGNTDFLVSKL